MSKSLKIIESEQGGACAHRPELHVAQSVRGLKPGSFRGRAAVVTLGCAKNQVDSEVMLGSLLQSGFEIVNDPAKADVAIVNTCGFLESAVKESLDSILELAAFKKSGQLRKLIVAGCVVERYKDDIKRNLPEVDAFLAVDDILKAGSVAAGEAGEVLLSAARPYFLYDDSMPRHLSTRSHSAYVKISDGCDRPCAFCTIPAIRGKLRSREFDSLVREVEALARGGVREINLIAQDLTAYGTDTKSASLCALLRRLDRERFVDWVRLLYSYPLGIDDELLDCINELPTVCEYLDLPLQHSSERILKAMRRPLGKFSPRRLVEFIKSRAPGIHLRTTFIAGFPGEKESDVDDLESFIREGYFSSVGVFTYSREEGTPAAAMPGQVAQAVKDARYQRLMVAQQEVNQKALLECVGREFEALVDGPHEETELLWTARTRFQAPEVDGTVIVNDAAAGLESLSTGRMVRLVISQSAGYDLIGTITRVVS